MGSSTHIYITLPCRYSLSLKKYIYSDHKYKGPQGRAARSQCQAARMLTVQVGLMWMPPLTIHCTRFNCSVEIYSVLVLAVQTNTTGHPSQADFIWPDNQCLSQVNGTHFNCSGNMYSVPTLTAADSSVSSQTMAQGPSTAPSATLSWLDCPDTVFLGHHPWLSLFTI